MAFSSNPAVRELQSGVGLRLPADPGRARRGRRRRRLDRERHRRDRPAAGRQRRAARRRTSASADAQALSDEVRRENEHADRRCSSSRPGSTTRPSRPTVISRESSEFRRVIGLDKGTNDGIKVGDVVVVGGGALAGRVTDVGPDSATVVLLTDGTLDGHRPARVDRRRPARSSASSAACWSWSRSTRARSSPRATRS